MKRLQFLIFALLFSAVSFGHEDENDPVVLTIEGHQIHASEFIYIYEKNNDSLSYKKKALDSYMELFINYKLKVIEAEHLGYDTIPRLQSELAEYRKQLAMPYLIDKKQNEKLVEEAYYRIKNEVHASHILIRVDPAATPEDTARAYDQIMALRDRVMKGEDFGEVAIGRGGSQDPSAAMNKGDLGYFSALQMVYPFEEAAFTTEPGSVSMPVRTRFGYHILKVHEIRPAKGKMTAAHIMVLANDKASEEEIKAAEEKANEIYALLEKGEKFDDLAKKYSDDQSSKGRGGALPEFGAGAKQRMVPEFEEAAFKLQNDGDYSKPIRTAYGFHIIKRVSLTPVPSYEEMYRELKMKVEKDERAQTTRNSFINKLKKDYGFGEADAAKLLPMFFSIGDEYFMGHWKGLTSDAHDDDVLFTFRDQFFTVKDFEQYLMSLQNQKRTKDMQTFVEARFKEYQIEKLLQYEDSQLEQKYPQFKALVQEYRDGILIFEIMQNEIWNKASKDTSGIKSYYESHKSDFTYPKRYQGELYKCIDKATAEKVVELLNTDTLSFGKIQEIVNENSQLNLIVKKHVFSSNSTDAFSYKKGKKTRTFEKGVSEIWEKDGQFYVIKVEEVLEPRPREFSEAKGLVTAAYQNQLEKEWIKSLREKYKYEVDYDALYSLKKIHKDLRLD
ncbi:peptidylprolyl isomerase [Paracrocinitomix mangrovi]|uniref:peptidylprolyl isomerase n=1 Tax=Paracrocinitomix mangrovi TaxID=2862509 RepID=UPI001C8E2E14|nr:peptidylprolyl isomerase [Paracrocinitomix mangrovi]UKN02883.1 peptidylprolyl isomerase [Paracrocinitomix mangrovi]